MKCKICGEKIKDVFNGQRTNPACKGLHSFIYYHYMVFTENGVEVSERGMEKLYEMEKFVNKNLS